MQVGCDCGVYGRWRSRPWHPLPLPHPRAVRDAGGLIYNTIVLSPIIRATSCPARCINDRGWLGHDPNTEVGARWRYAAD